MPGMLQQAQQSADLARELPLAPAQQPQPAQPAAAGPQGPAPAQPAPGPAQAAPGPAQAAPGPDQAGGADPMAEAAGVPTDVSGEGGETVPAEQGPDELLMEGAGDPGDVSAHTPDSPPPSPDEIHIRTKMHQASEDEQREYKRAIAALSKVLYSNNKTNASILQALASTKQDKIDPLAKTGILLIKQLDDKLDFDEAIVAQFTQDTVERLIELAEARHGVEYSPVEYQQALGTTWEGVMAAFGVSEQHYKEFTESVAPEDLVTAKRAYQGALHHG